MIIAANFAAMLKKYLPIIALLAAIAFLYWVKTNQRGAGKSSVQVELNRNPSRLIYSKHARCRMDCRHIDELEVKEILAKGSINVEKIETDSRGTTYPLEGITRQGQKVRIVFAPKKDGSMVVVTVIDLEKEYQCHCN